MSPSSPPDPPHANPSGVPAAPPGLAERSGVVLSMFRRRWNVPILAELARRDGAKFATLSHVTGAVPGAVRASLDDLIIRGWVTPNPGYGHPLRPEYILTPQGQRLAQTCICLDEALLASGLREIGLRKWSMPVLDLLGHTPRRFGEIATSLGHITDRALSLTLRDLDNALLVSRAVLAARPPASLYAPTPTGGRLAEILSGV